jgi:hypothetical protein
MQTRMSVQKRDAGYYAVLGTIYKFTTADRLLFLHCQADKGLAPRWVTPQLTQVTFEFSSGNDPSSSSVIAARIVLIGRRKMYHTFV